MVLKDSALDYSRGITMLQYPWEYKDILSRDHKGGQDGANSKLYVLQPHIPNPLCTMVHISFTSVCTC